MTVTQGGTIVFSVVVTPASTAPSTITAVTLNASVLGAGEIQLNDRGQNGDAAAGDHVWTATFPFAPDAPASGYVATFTITDIQDRQGFGNIFFTIEYPSWDEASSGGGDTGDLPGAAQVPFPSTSSRTLGSLTGILGANDADMYRITICDPANFLATTIGGAAFDTQLFLFDLSGRGVTFNDDTSTAQSRITSFYIPAAGDYYLAISRYDHDPVDQFGQQLWIDTPFVIERTPDGLGALNPIAAWIGNTSGAVPYRIYITGVCFSTGGCSADFDHNDTLNPDDLGDFINCYFQQTRTGSCPDADFNRDGSTDGDDLGDFINAYFAGCT